jgi:LmbE family N-acetylglucosaminyl deacetylase
VKRAASIRIKIYGGIVLALVGLYFYQPVRIDFFQKPIPNPNPPVDPDSKKLFSPGAKVMIVTAHPDDAEYYLGPLLVKLGETKAQIDLVVCTDGDKSYYPWQNGGEMRRIRRQEQLNAAAYWHAHSVWFLGYPDGRLQPRDDVVAGIRKQVLLDEPEWLITFDGDYPPKVSHGDHRSAGQAAWKAVQGTGIKWVMMFASRAFNYTADVSREEAAENTLLAMHKSEFEGAKLDRVGTSVANDFSEAGDRIGKPFGVSLRCVKL